MARSVTGLFNDAAHVDRILGALRDAGFDDTKISVASPDGATTGDGSTPATTPSHGIGGWLAEHLRKRGVPHEHAERYQDQVAGGRQLVSVSVTTDAEDEEARSLMVDTGADEISSAADGTLHPFGRSGAPGAILPD